MKRYKSLLFDIDGTLLDFDADMRAAFEKLYQRCSFGESLPYAPSLLEIYRKHNAAWWETFNLGQCSKTEVELGGFAGFLTETGLRGDPDFMKEEYNFLLLHGGVLYPGAEEMLQTLSKEFPIYIVTNGNAATAKTRIENSGVGRYIRDYFVSEAVGYAKPDPRYFEYVFSHISHFQKEQAVVIGDGLLSDMLGAQNVGLDSIWYDPENSENPHGISYTYRAKTYEDIVRILTHE